MPAIDLIVKGGRIVTPAEIIEANLYVREGTIVGIGKMESSASNEVDAAGCLVLPGMLDAHVHFMDPGETQREDFPTGSRAAAAAGVTTVIEHTHAAPVHTGAGLKEKAEYLKRRSAVDFALGAHFPPSRIEDIGEAIDAGAAFIKVLTCTTHGIQAVGTPVLYRAMARYGKSGIPFLFHAEDDALTEAAEIELKKSGRRDGGVIPESRSRLAERIAAATVGFIAGETRAKSIIAHCSHPFIVDLVAEFRGKGAPVYAESCPQYLILKEDEILREGAFRKFTPPARAESDSDIDAMWDRLESGAITYMASDHAPATAAQKSAGNIWEAPYGLPGIDTTSRILIDAAVRGRLSYPRLAEIYSKMPALLYGLYPRKGALRVGSDADFILVDPSAKSVLENSDIVSKAGWTPYAGSELSGQVVAAFLRGRKIAENGKCIVPEGNGRFIPLRWEALS